MWRRRCSDVDVARKNGVSERNLVARRAPRADERSVDVAHASYGMDIYINRSLLVHIYDCQKTTLNQNVTDFHTLVRCRFM